MKLLLYSFDVFPWQKQLEGLGFKVFYFNKLKEDLEIFKKRILEEQPDLILGFAKSELNKSTIEAFCINKFGKNKKVSKQNPIEIFSLFVSEDLPDFLSIRKTPTNTFCDWTMFKISEVLDEEKLETRLSFIHVLEKNLAEFEDYILNL